MLEEWELEVDAGLDIEVLLDMDAGGLDVGPEVEVIGAVNTIVPEVEVLLELVVA